MPKKKEETPKIVRITLVRSPIGYSERQKATVRALGLRRINQTVEHQDSPTLRGMIAKVAHLIDVEEGNEA
ncbi:MAG: LSU ribosomal protein L30p (L7e) [Anaerolineae bacterium]|jgi:large subunit ribosomal protein L30|nr:MAG: LSU ribosomal protein L30p (L7e) [Anaerolineae bacterium]